MKKNLMEFLPPVLQKVFEFQKLCDGEQPEFDRLHEAWQEVFDNQFYDTAHESGIKRYESILGIVPPAADTLDDRRFQIRVSMAEQLPITMQTLEQQLLEYCGADNYEITLIPSLYQLNILIYLPAESQVNTIKEYVSRILPCNITVQINLKYNIHSFLSGFTHAELYRYTNIELKDEVLTNAG